MIKKNNSFLLKILLSSIVRRRSRLMVALVGIAIGATVLLGMVTLCYDIPRQMSREFRSYGANMILVAAGRESLMMRADIENAAALLPPEKVLGLTPYRYETVRSNMLPYTAVGVDFAQVRKTSPYWHVTGQWPERDGEILIGADVAEFTRLVPGRGLTLEGRNKEQARYEKDVTVTGLLKTGGVEDGFIFMSLESMEEMTGEPGFVDVAEISVMASGRELRDLAEAVRSGQSRVEARLVKRVTQSEETVLGKLKTLVYLVTVIVLVLTMICVATTMMTVVMERRREIGLKKAIGAENRSIAREFLAEGLILGLLGGLLGSACGLLFAQVISANVFNRSVTVEFYLIPATVLVSALVTIIACLIPVRRAVDVEPALVLRGE
ncbi:MAG: ABC transporter permease [Candidatus Adiutrix sp.]|jgi:putative ABC transport system permease protein|nr:ABC transporter permease [Candidatus Adiutrix sp.]